MSPEANALLDSRMDPEAPMPVGIATTWFGNVRNSVDVRTYQVLFGLDGALQNDWTWEFYVCDGSSLIQNEYVGTTSTQRWRYVINQPNYGAGLFAQGNAEGNGFGAGSLSCTSGFSTLGQGERYYLEATGYQTELPSQDCLNATGANLAAGSTMKQQVAEFNLQGSGRVLQQCEPALWRPAVLLHRFERLCLRLAVVHNSRLQPECLVGHPALETPAAHRFTG